MAKTRLAAVVLISSFLVVLVPSKAFAYIDPGTGSFVLQIVLAAIFGGLVALRIFWSKIKRLFKKADPPTTSNDSGE